MRCSHQTTVKWCWLKISNFIHSVNTIYYLFARRLQIQENLTQQIAEAVAEVTGARGVAVMIDSAHMCMMMRGVGKQESTTRTVSFIGDFKTNKEERREFLSAVPESY